MIKSFYYKTLLGIFTAFFLFANPVLAQDPPTISRLFKVIYDALGFFFGFVAIVSAGMILYGAYMWMFSAGDPQKIKIAQGALTWAVVGLIFFMTFRFLLDFILRVLGIELPVPDGTQVF